MAKISRSGGAFDPEGTRAQDVYRADDLVAMVQALPRRWVVITLTVNREWFTSPEAAYQRCNEYVRKAVAPAVPTGIYVTAFEVQGKTGAGWPHWHVLAYCPDGRSDAQIKGEVVRRWRTRTEHVDQDTGEVSVSSELIGWVDVSSCRSSVGAGKYLAKYMVKAWNAVPPWMLRSSRRFRKLRWSNRSYDVLVKLHRHDRRRGGREKFKGTGRRTRPLLQRMARSGDSLVMFRVDRSSSSGLRFAGTLPVPRDRLAALVDRGSLSVLRLGRYASMVFEVSPGFAHLVRERGAEWRAEQRRYRSEREHLAAGAWARVQSGEEVDPWTS